MTAPLRQLTRSVTVDAAPGRVFSFHLDPANAALVCPPGMRVVVHAASVPLTVGAEAEMGIRARRVPLGRRWRIRVDEIVPGRLMVDRALRSPFARWRHEHLFAPAAGGTVMTDRVTYAVRGGRVGDLLAGALTAAALRLVFRSRQRRTARHFARTAA